MSISASTWPLSKPMRRHGSSALIGVALALVIALLLSLQPAWLSGPRDGGAAKNTASLDGRVGASANELQAAALAAVLANDNAQEKRLESLARRTSTGALALAAALASVGLFAAAFAWTQRSRADAMLALSAGAWMLHALLSSRIMPGAASGPAPSLWMVQPVLLAAVATLFWNALRMAGWRATAHARAPLLPAWAFGIALALVVAWSRGVDESTGPWFVPIACLSAGGFILVHLLPAWRHDRLRPVSRWGFFSLVGLGALAIGGGACEIGLHVLEPQALELRATTWFVTRWTVAALLALMVSWRFAQVAEAFRRLDRNHRRMRRALQSSEAEARDLQCGLGVRDLLAQQLTQRDQVAREALEDIGSDLGAVNSPALEEALHNLTLVQACLCVAPRPLREAFDTLMPRLQAPVCLAGGRLDWQVDPRTRDLVLPASETLMWQRLACEAITVACGLGWAPSGLRLRLEVSDVETGLHLRLKVAPSTDVITPFGPAVDKDLFGAPLLPAALESRQRLQRFATALAAQMVLETRPGQRAAIDVVKPLRAR